MNKAFRKDNLKVSDPDFKKYWEAYKKDNKHKSRRMKINSQREHIKIIKECFRTISHYWTNSTGGVYVHELGYFTLLRPLKKFEGRDSKDYISNIYRTKGYSYLLTHITDLKHVDSFRGFKIRRAFDPVKKDARNNIIKGRRYTINSSLIKEFLKRKKYL